MVTTLNMLLQMRRDDVFTSTYVLEKGEPGFEISTNTLKIGDGTKTWAELDIANKAAIDALIKVVDDKVAALNDTYATDAEVEEIRKALAAAIDTKLAAETFNDYSATRQLTDTDINTAIGNVDAKFASYRTSADQDVIDNAIKGRLDTLEAKPFDTYATKSEVGQVATDLSEYETANDARVKAVEDEIATYGDIVTHNAAEFEAAGTAAEALKNYYTKDEADAAFTTPAEVISEVNKALSEVSNADTITNITTLVEYVNEHGGDLTELISEVYGSAEMTGDSRLDVIEAKAAMGITADDIAAWNAEKGVKAIVDANKSKWDKAETALQAADLADYAKTADVVTNDEFTAFEATNTEAIGKKLDTATFEAFNNGTSKTVAAIEADIVAKANAAQAAAEATAQDALDAYKEEVSDALADKVTVNSPISVSYMTEGAEGEEWAVESKINAGEILVEAGEYSNSVRLDAFGASIELIQGGVNPTTITSDGIQIDNETISFPRQSGTFALTSDVKAVEDKVDAINVGVTEIIKGNDIVVTPGEDGKVTVAHETFVTGEYTKDPATSDKTGDQYFFTGVTVDNGHVTGANVKSLASVLEGMTFVFDGGSSTSNV